MNADIQEAVIDYLYDEMEASERIRFENRMSTDAQLRQQVEEMRRILTDIRSQPVPQVSPNTLDKIRAQASKSIIRAAEPITINSRPRHKLARNWPAIASMAAAVLIGSIWTLKLYENQSETKTEQPLRESTDEAPAPAAFESTETESASEQKAEGREGEYDPADDKAVSPKPSRAGSSTESTRSKRMRRYADPKAPQNTYGYGKGASPPASPAKAKQLEAIGGKSDSLRQSAKAFQEEETQNKNSSVSAAPSPEITADQVTQKDCKKQLAIIERDLKNNRITPNDARQRAQSCYAWLNTNRTIYPLTWSASNN